MKRQRGGKYGIASDGISNAFDTIISYNAQMKRLRNKKKMQKFYRTEALAPPKIRQNRNKALLLYNKYLIQRDKDRKSFYKKYGHLLKPK